MAILGRYSMPVRTRSLRFLVVGMLFAVPESPYVAGSTAHAAPVTFRFDATITHALAGNPFDLPFDYQVGDVISGKLAFEPGAGTPIGDNAIGADQFQGLGLVIDGVEFGSSSYNIRVINDTAFDDTEFEGQLDTMTIRCSPSDPQPCTPALISLQGGDPFAITERLELVGDSDILDSATVSSERDIWNSFTLRRALAVTFDNATGGSMLLRANVGQFEAVPEPPNSLVFVCFLIFCLLAFLARKRLRPRATTGEGQICFVNS